MAAPLLRIEFVDGTTRDLRVGAFAQIAAKRRFGLDMIKAGDPEAGLYSAWIELEGPVTNGHGDEQFDVWLQTVTGFDIATDDEDDADPTPAESSVSSPESPPTSASTPSD